MLTKQEILDAIDELLNQQAMLEYEINVRRHMVADGMKAIDGMVNLYRTLGGKIEIDKKLNVLSPNAKLGDAVETILKRAGVPLTKEAIIKQVRDAGVRLSEKYPVIVLNTALKRDTKQRFVVLDDSTVWLKGKKKGNK